MLFRSDVKVAITDASLRECDNKAKWGQTQLITNYESKGV